MNQVAQFDPANKAHKDDDSLWEVRTGERPYAFLKDPVCDDSNHYGQKINLLELNPGWKKGESLYINGNPAVGSNPNRNKQHGFFFTADNCIGCHACEAACSEKNNNPGHIAFRSVGYVEGGCYPDYQRMNISMACNHCDDPVCLKGCPTGAYIKHTEYGAVLQDPETCFGCGYCTWVCPYNAPQLDPVQGQVSKCNMCVDRLEVGLKPACVSACLGNALDFGVIENIPENREEAKTTIPGFPSPEITHPNIRFQQTRTLPEDMRRPDSAPVKYRRQEDGRYHPSVDRKDGLARQWSLGKLSSRENPLVMFTLLSQAAIGIFYLVFAGSLLGVDSISVLRQSPAYIPLVLISSAMVALGLFFSTTHLGKPLWFYRGFNNLRYSPVCREGLGLALFIAFSGLHGLFAIPSIPAANALIQSLTGISVDPASGTTLSLMFGLAALLGGAGGLGYMIRCYLIKARPFWNHWNTAADFIGTALVLGSWISGAVLFTYLSYISADLLTAHQLYRGLLIAGLVSLLAGQLGHRKAMSRADHEGGASWYIQSTVFGKTQTLRITLLVINLLFSVVLLTTSIPVQGILVGWLISGLALGLSQLIGRALFYVLVIPTTMPGAFFWKNKGFEQHARDIGLADFPQTGLVSSGH